MNKTFSLYMAHNCHFLKNNTVNNLSETILYFLNKKKKFFKEGKNIDYSINNSGKIILDVIKKN